jgi:hypothetical protein
MIRYFFYCAIAFYSLVPTFASTIGFRKSILVQFVLIADVAKLVDALDLGSSAARHGGSSPSIRTKIPNPQSLNCLQQQGRDWGFLVNLHY